jgi:hypothetical protein
LTVRILNELTAPINTADVKILVFVRTSDNIEFANPIHVAPDNRLSPYTVQSGILSYDDDNTMEESIALFPSISPPENNLVYFGETIKSIRTLLRRTVFSRLSTFQRTSNANMVNVVGGYANRFPLYPGFDPNGINNATGLTSGVSTPFNFTSYTYINWFGQCFLGHRGAINWKINNLNPNITTENRITRPYRTFQQLTRTGYNQLYSSSSTSISAQSNAPLYSCGFSSGGSVTNPRTLSSNSASIPMYSQYKFFSPSPETTTLGDSVDGSLYDGFHYQLIYLNATSNVANAQFWSGSMANFYCAAGTDFDLVFFMAVPTLYYYNSYPTAQADPV